MVLTKVSVLLATGIFLYNFLRLVFFFIIEYSSFARAMYIFSESVACLFIFFMVSLVRKF